MNKKKKKATKANANLSKEMFTDLWKIYRDARGGAAEACMPGDLDNLISQSGSIPLRTSAKHLAAIYILLK